MLTGVVAFLLSLFALLSIPVTMMFQVSWQQALQSDIKLLWLFGLVHVRLPSFQSKAPSLEGEELAQKNIYFERSPRKNSSLFAVIWQKAFRRRIIRFISDSWHAVHKRDISLRIRIGLGDPADTGQLWAVVGPVAGILSNVQDASIQILPDFLDTTFELDSSGNIRIIPLQIIYLTIGLLLSPPVWQGIKQMRKVE
jgi:hypothetical protein